MFGKKYDDVLNSIPLKDLLGKALVYKEGKTNKAYAVIFTEEDVTAEPAYINLDALRRGLIQVYNYAKVNKLSTIAIAGDISVQRKSNIVLFDVESLIDELFRFTEDIEIQVFIKE